jgi:hypothetical protein
MVQAESVLFPPGYPGGERRYLPLHPTPLVQPGEDIIAFRWLTAKLSHLPFLAGTNMLLISSSVKEYPPFHPAQSGGWQCIPFSSPVHTFLVIVPPPIRPGGIRCRNVL